MSALDQIENFVVLMLENRSFDNLLGWNAPTGTPNYIPADNTSPYAGLSTEMTGCPTNPDYFTDPSQPPNYIGPVEGTDATDMPHPDPQEAFLNMNFQLFGSQTLPVASQGSPAMEGFVVDYMNSFDFNKDLAYQLMQCYTPDQLPFLSWLANEYAVCDAWFASTPTQTYPNRSFVHCGNSNGKVNNTIDKEFPAGFDSLTVFNVLEEQGVDWGVFYTDYCLVQRELSATAGLSNFYKYSKEDLFGNQESSSFLYKAQNGLLPKYTFIEPSYIPLLHSVQSMHPPFAVPAGDAFLQSVFTALSTGPKWNNTLLLVTYDEHGGCYDHVPTPWGATPPSVDSQGNPIPGEYGFLFDRFGVRVPTVLVSPLVQQGTIFRSPTSVPYDHTSVLATLFKWLNLDQQGLLPSNRTAAAPTFDNVLTDSVQSHNPPPAMPAFQPAKEAMEAAQKVPLGDFHKGVLRRAMAEREGLQLGTEAADARFAELSKTVRTMGDLARYLGLE